ncbi:Cilia- And Flagella-Associated Protein 74 [Manis pentadactyla]|nr:Cilia- And Flagella-Associated Protein 74 [Manis pentadactyla]
MTCVPPAAASLVKDTLENSDCSERWWRGWSCYFLTFTMIVNMMRIFRSEGQNKRNFKNTNEAHYEPPQASGFLKTTPKHRQAQGVLDSTLDKASDQVPNEIMYIHELYNYKVVVLKYSISFTRETIKKLLRAREYWT